MVYYLIKEKGMTLAGAKQRLKQSKSAVASDSEIVRRLKVVRDELARMRQELDYIT